MKIQIISWQTVQWKYGWYTVFPEEYFFKIVFSSTAPPTDRQYQSKGTSFHTQGDQWECIKSK